MMGKAGGSTDPSRTTEPTRVAFLAIAQAHQFLHWLPAALRLSREPGVEVTVLGGSPAGLDFIRSFDPGGRLQLKQLMAPSLSRDGLFTPPSRGLALLLNQHIIRRYPTIVTSETTSSLLKSFPSFKSRLVQIKHGAGDGAAGYKSDYRLFDLTLVAGEKDKRRLIERGFATEENCVIAGYAKFELIKPSTTLFSDDNPVALYNPHFEPKLSSWFEHGPAIVQEMERIPDWNFVVAPHVKLIGGPDVRSAAPNFLMDRGSARSIDMSYTQAADVYIGDVSSQVYEFILRPRPCIFINFDRRNWQGDENYAHWHVGQVIDCVDQLAPALERAKALQPRFEEAQRKMVDYSIDRAGEPASERQARAILSFARGAV